MAHRVHRPQGKQARVADLLNLGRSWGGESRPLGTMEVNRIGQGPRWNRGATVSVVVGSNPSASVEH